MSVEAYQREIQRRQQELARLQQFKAGEIAKAADEARKANADSEAATRASSTSTRQSRLRDAQRHHENVVRANKSVADIEKRISREQSSLTDAQRKLTEAKKKEDRQRLQDQERTERAHQKKMQNIAGALARHDSLHRDTQDAIRKLQELPERITVLFLAANPLDQQQLRLDEEARSIHGMIRMAEHRDAVRLESRWAVRSGDVLQALNEVEPTIVHFSGHGSDASEIIFQGGDGLAKPVKKEAIVQAMAFGSDAIELVFFNTCFSAGQAEAVVEHVPASIGMNASIGEDAARTFASQFYSAIGFGYSLKRAFDQGKAALMLEGIPEESTPELFVRDGVDPEQLFLVRPPGA